MRSTIEIDDTLLREAQQLTGIRTKKELVNLSLRELVRRKRLEHLLSLYGTSPIDLTPEDVESFREDDGR